MRGRKRSKSHVCVEGTVLGPRGLLGPGPKRECRACWRMYVRGWRLARRDKEQEFKAR